MLCDRAMHTIDDWLSLAWQMCDTQRARLRSIVDFEVYTTLPIDSLPKISSLTARQIS